MAASSPRARRTTIFTTVILSRTFNSEMRVVRDSDTGAMLVAEAGSHRPFADLLSTIGRLRKARLRAMIDFFTEPMHYEFFQNGLIAATLVGALCGMMGVYIVLRRMSYIGHGLSHAVFGGAVVSYIIGCEFLSRRRALGIRLGPPDQRHRSTPENRRRRRDRHHHHRFLCARRGADQQDTQLHPQFRSGAVRQYPRRRLRKISGSSAA